MKAEELIQLSKVSYSVRSTGLSLRINESTDILNEINFSIFENEILGICGESGGGKSTLAKIISGIIKPTTGSIILNKNLTPEENEPRHIQILFQNNSSLLNPYRKICSVVEESILISGVEKNNIVETKRRIYNNLSIKDELDNRKGYELSGGERQRVALARLLAVNPKILILDEPFSAQDVGSQENLTELFKKINKKFNCTIICISHNLKILRNFVQRLIVLQNGRIIEQGSSNEIFNSPNHPYTKFLLRAEELALTKEEIHSSSLK